MVAACSANRLSDTSASPVASEIGSLLLEYRSIFNPRWRLRAVVALVPLCKRFGIAVIPFHDELRRGERAATCPAFWRERVIPLLDEHPGSLRLVDALFTREWRACGRIAKEAMLAMGDVPEAERLAIAASEHRYAAEAALALVRSGCADGVFVGNVDAPDSERAYRPSLLLLRACVDAIVKQRQRARVNDVERLARSVPTRERGLAEAQLARLNLCFESAAAALARVRAIRERSIRAGGFLLLTRATDDLAAKRWFASSIDTKLLRQAATLEIARALGQRGLHRPALRALQYVDEPRLLAERMLLVAELHLSSSRSAAVDMLVTAQALRAAYRVPAWSYVTPRLEPCITHDLVQTVLRLRSGADCSAELLRRHASCRAARRYFVELSQGAGIDVDDALRSLQDERNSAALDALRAERIAMAAESLIERPLSGPMMLGLAARPVSVSDARSLERAQYDEALALSSTAATRRRVLITTAQACLRAALAIPGEWPLEVVATRLRTLAHLGGGLALDAIRKALVGLPLHATLTPLAFDALCKLDAAAAKSFALERASQLHAAGIDLVRVLQLLEQHAALPRGTSRAVAAAARALARQGVEPQGWLAELFALMRDRADALLRVLRCVSATESLAESPRALLADVEAVPLRLVARDHSTIAQLLATDTSLLEAHLVARPANVDPKMASWSTDQWRDLLRQAVDYATVHEPQLTRFVRKVGRRHWYAALRNASLAQLGVITSTTFAVDGATYRLRLLDKRRDILTYLRFADTPARSCFRSDSTYRLPGDTIEAWKDPLTICFHIERGDRAESCGFWFGSFAAVEHQPALVMNSLHVRPNHGELRRQVVHAFERAICGPLSISRIGIANVHGGKGELPPSYASRPVTLTRFRALAQDGWPLAQTYDDISDRLHEPVLVDGLFWRS